MAKTEFNVVKSVLKQLNETIRQFPPDEQERAARLVAQLDAYASYQLQADRLMNQERFQAVLDYSLDVVYRRDLLADTYDYMSASSSQILTYTIAEMNAMSIEEVMDHIHPDDRTAVIEGMQLADETGSGRLEYRWRGRDGHYRRVADYVNVQKDAHGRPTYRGGILRDITAQRQIEEDLRQSEERFRIALSSSPITVFSHDRDLRYTWVFNSFLRLPLDQILGKRDDELLPPGDVAELVAVKQAVLDSGHAYSREVKLRVNGQDMWRIVTVEPVLDAKGAITGISGAGFDLTDLRRLQIENTERQTEVEVQRRLMRHREAERQDIARELHDGPIQTLVSVLFSLQMASEASSNTDMQQEIEKIRAELKSVVRELRDTVNDLRPPSLAHFGLSKVIQMHAQDYQERHPEMRILLNLFDDQNLINNEISLALYRIYQEGLNNALFHGEATQVEVSYQLANGMLELQMCDNGQGFDPGNDRAELTRNGHFGLAGIAERVESVGGQLSIFSKTGEGALLSVLVPFRAR